MRERQKVNPSTKLTHSSIDFGSGTRNEIIEPKITTTPFEPLTKHPTSTHIPFVPLTKSTPQTFTICFSSDSDTHSSDEMFHRTLTKILAALKYKLNHCPLNIELPTYTPSPLHTNPPQTPIQTTSQKVYRV